MKEGSSARIGLGEFSSDLFGGNIILNRLGRLREEVNHIHSSSNINGNNNNNRQQNQSNNMLN